jgi:hypothetical protein
MNSIKCSELKPFTVYKFDDIFYLIGFKNTYYRFFSEQINEFTYPVIEYSSFKYEEIIKTGEEIIPMIFEYKWVKR